MGEWPGPADLRRQGLRITCGLFASLGRDLPRARQACHVADLDAQRVDERHVGVDHGLVAEPGPTQLAQGIQSVGQAPNDVGVGRGHIVERRAGAAKEVIARKLSPLVPSGGVGICMDASSTISALARSLPHSENLSVITDGVETFLTLTRDSRIHAYLTGGQKDPNAGSLIGPVATSTLRQFSFARAFLSAAAIDARFGTSEFSAEECEVKKLMAQLSDHVVLAAHSKKFETGSAARCLTWENIDLLVTELETTDPRLDQYRDLVEIL